jgi:hypothetical protein
VGSVRRWARMAASRRRRRHELASCTGLGQGHRSAGPTQGKAAHDSFSNIESLFQFEKNQQEGIKIVEIVRYLRKM